MAMDDGGGMEGDAALNANISLCPLFPAFGSLALRQIWRNHRFSSFLSSAFCLG